MQQARQPLAIDLVQQFRQLRVLVIGDALLDSYLEGDAARLSRDGPIPVIRKRHEQRLPGGAANVAANLRALEAEVFLLSIIGADIAGSLLRTALRERGIDDSWLIEEKYINTPHKLRILADGQHVARFDEGSDDTAPRTPENQARLLAHLEALYARCDAVLISDYGYGVLSNDVIECLKTLHCANPKAMLVDAQELARFRTFPATVITPNYQEARRFVEASIGNIPSTDEQPGPDNHTHITFLAQQMLNELATETVTITLAEHGAFLLDRQGHAHHFPAHPIETPHDVGAGDSYASAFILALAAGHKLPEAVQIGIDAAGIAVTKPRTAVVSYQELLQRVSLRVYAAQAQSIEDNNTDDDSSDTQTARSRKTGR
jgi:D-beta-D-heptose 7-phosphate kinase/D-beta-D-heptose 1-phosphate adenosyltransferase